MDLQALLGQLQGGQQGGPQSGQPAQQGGGLDQNPFEHILQSLPQAGQGQQEPQGMPVGPDGQPMPDATNPGENPGGSKQLLGALKAIQDFITQASDKDEIAVARSITLLLTKLIQQDQMKQGEYDGQAPAAPQGPAGAAGGGQNALMQAMAAAKGGAGGPGGAPQGQPAY